MDKIIFSKERAGVKTWEEDKRKGPVKEIYYALLEEYKTPRFERYGPEFEKLFLAMMA